MLALASGHRARGHRVHVAAVLPEPPRGHPFVSGLERSGVQVSTIEVGGRSYVRERAAVRALCADLRPQVVHTHGYRPDVVDAGVAREVGIPIVTTVHGFTGGGLRNRAYEWVQERALRRFDAVVAVSQPLAARLRARGIRADRLHVIPNGFDADAPRLDRLRAREALNIPPDRFTVGWVGRISHEKGPDVFLRALDLLNDASVDALMLGDGPLRAALERGGTGAGSLRWSGVVPGAGALYAAFDAFVLSSRTEGIPIALLEAMAAGTPIVAARVGGVPEMLSDAEAVLVPPDDPRALAAALAAVRADPGGARERATRARVRLEREFSLPAWLDRYEAVYHSLAGDVRVAASGVAGETPRAERAR